MEFRSNNVIEFPLNNKKLNIEEPDTELVDIQINLMKINHINETLNVLLPILFNNVDIAGFTVMEDESDKNINMKDTILIVESIRSLLYKLYGLYHPFQEVAEKVFDDSKDCDIVEKLEVKFSHKEFITVENINNNE